MHLYLGYNIKTEVTRSNKCKKHKKKRLENTKMATESKLVQNKCEF